MKNHVWRSAIKFLALSGLVYCFCYCFSCDQKQKTGINVRNETNNLKSSNFSLRNKQELIFEYDNEKTISTADLVEVYSTTFNNTEITVESDPPYLSLADVGRKQVNYKITSYDDVGNKVSKECRRLILIVDTSDPIIQLKKETVVINEGDTWDANSNIETVYDEVDGVFEQVKKTEIPACLFKGDTESEKGTTQLYDHGWYYFDSNVDVNKPGSYTVSITACDKNGNTVTDSFDVTVEAPKPIASISYKRQDNNDSTGSIYVGTNTETANYGSFQNSANTSTGNSGKNDVVTDTTPSVNQTPSTATTPVIDTSIPAGTFPTYSAASAWANAQLDADIEAWYAGTLANPRTGFYADAYYTSSGIEYWIVTFY